MRIDDPSGRACRVVIDHHTRFRMNPSNGARNWRITDWTSLGGWLLGVGLLGVGTLCGAGCSLSAWNRQPQAAGCNSSVDSPGCGPTELRISEPCIEQRCLNNWSEAISPLELDESTLSAENTLELSLEDCIQRALAHSPILRDLGGAVLRSPQSQGTRFEPAILAADPRLGHDAALADFDANISAGLNFEKVDRPSSSTLYGNGGQLLQDVHTYQWQLSKRSATGGKYSIRNVTLYDSNNQPSNQIRSTFDTYLEGEIRHPLLQGAGTEFNRIAGPNGTPGNIQGVLVARVRQDISLTDFEKNVRDCVADVENAYWDLYFAYRDLHAKIDVRDKAKEIFEKERARQATNTDGSDAAAPTSQAGDVDQAEEQYFRFQADVLDALNGRPLDATRTYNGSSGGTFRGNGGLRVAERRLRWIMGMEINDGQIIRPIDQPPEAAVIYDWDSAISEAVSRREEVRRQRWVIKQRELELVASRNFLLPQLDLVGRYRYRGFGEDLWGGSGDGYIADGAAANLLNGNYQEWQAGVEFLMPVGYRRAHAAVRNAQLQLEREREILREQERSIYYGLSNAFCEVRRSYDNRQLQLQRLEATAKQIDKLQERRASGRGAAPLDVILEAYRRYLDIRLRFHQAEVEYVLALRNIQFEKGSLLEYCNVRLTESESPRLAYENAKERASQRGPAHSPGARDPVVAR
jgi:outer membrane protein TolC